VYTAQTDVLGLQVLDSPWRAFDAAIEDDCARLRLKRQEYPKRDKKPNRIVQKPVCDVENRVEDGIEKS
jgi:hypothetical protein